MCNRYKKQRRGKVRKEPMPKQVMDAVRTAPEAWTPRQADRIAPLPESRLRLQEKTKTKNGPNVNVFVQSISTSISILPEQVPTSQELAFRDKLRKEIQRLEGILADGTYTAEDQTNARDSLRAAGIIDENDELLPYFQPSAGEE